MRKQQRISKAKIAKAIDALKALNKKELDDVNARKNIKNMYRQYAPLRGHAVLFNMF